MRRSRAAAWTAGILTTVTVLLTGAVFVTAYAAPSDSTGGDTCPVLSSTARGFMEYSELAASLLAPVAIAALVRARRTFGTVAVTVCGFFVVAGCVLGWLLFAVLGACGS